MTIVPTQINISKDSSLISVWVGVQWCKQLKTSSKACGTFTSCIHAEVCSRFYKRVRFSCGLPFASLSLISSGKHVGNLHMLSVSATLWLICYASVVSAWYLRHCTDLLTNCECVCSRYLSLLCIE